MACGNPLSCVGPREKIWTPREITPYSAACSPSAGIVPGSSSANTTPTTVTGCAYKGFAQYWSVNAGSTTVKDLAWSYKTPLPESVKIAGFVAFYNERADFTVDGERQVRPKTKFS